MGMKAFLPLFVFIDACGWEIIKQDRFALRFAPHRRRLASVFGYSSACVPSIVSGRWPVEHRNWCYFVYDPKQSPFRSLQGLRFLPHAIAHRRIVRRQLSRWVKRLLGFGGYFDLYNIPFGDISLFNFTERRSPLRPGGLNCGQNIFDYLTEEGIAYHVSRPEEGEQANLTSIIGEIEGERIDFAFVYWPGLDGLMHRTGNDSPAVPAKLRQYEAWIEQLLAAAQAHYEEVRLYVFSDHGMANCEILLDLRSQILALPLTAGRDYAVVYDSTMARFWLFNEGARRLITDCLDQLPEGRILPDAELEGLGALFPDRYFGELIFLVKEGVLIVPSDMGERPIRAMHGYHPSEPQSYAALCTNHTDVPEEITAIPHIHRLMVRDADTARTLNRCGAKRPVAMLAASE
jgi:hypothetical protein